MASVPPSAPPASTPRLRTHRLRLTSPTERLWCALTIIDYPEQPSVPRVLVESLSDDERRSLARLHRVSRALEYAYSRFAAKAAVRALVGRDLPSTQVSVSTGIFRQPLLSVPGNPGLGVSITHDDRRAAAIVFPHSCPLGIDVQRIDPRTQIAIRDQLTPHERRLISDAGQAAREVAAALLWTAKEALSKALGCGFTVPLEVLEVRLVAVDAREATAEFTNFPHYRATGWVDDGSVMMLAHPRPARITAPETDA